MARKSLNAMKGVKVTTVFHENKPKSNTRYGTKERAEQINNCLNCTKPVSECKGDCYKKNK